VVVAMAGLPEVLCWARTSNSLARSAAHSLPLATSVSVSSLFHCALLFDSRP
jgi:hypothetical protein